MKSHSSSLAISLAGSLLIAGSSVAGNAKTSAVNRPIYYLDHQPLVDISAELPVDPGMDPEPQRDSHNGGRNGSRDGSRDGGRGNDDKDHENVNRKVINKSPGRDE